jgi:hypothetical protein
MAQHILLYFLMIRNPFYQLLRKLLRAIKDQTCRIECQLNEGVALERFETVDEGFFKSF